MARNHVPSKLTFLISTHYVANIIISICQRIKTYRCDWKIRRCAISNRKSKKKTHARRVTVVVDPANHPKDHHWTYAIRSTWIIKSLFDLAFHQLPHSAIVYNSINFFSQSSTHQQTNFFSFHYVLFSVTSANHQLWHIDSDQCNSTKINFNSRVILITIIARLYCF